MEKKKAPLYAPVREDTSGGVSVELSADHPGFKDAAYRERRNAIAAVALRHQPGNPIPEVEYTDREHGVWRTITKELAPRHARLACAEYLEAADVIRLPGDRVPQLQEVSDRLGGLQGFSLAPAAGLVPLADFYGTLADSTFQATQYIRHHSVPLYTPEPDVVHEIIGHGVHLASPRFAEIYRHVGDATRRVRTQEALQLISRVFWFTFEYGVLREGGQVKAYGAGLLSSFGELGQMADAEIRPLDLEVIARHVNYDVTTYQPVLYCADSFDHLVDFTTGFFTSVSDETPGRLALAG